MLRSLLPVLAGAVRLSFWLDPEALAVAEQESDSLSESESFSSLDSSHAHDRLPGSRLDVSPSLAAPAWHESALRRYLQETAGEFIGDRLRARLAEWRSLNPQPPARVLRWIAP